MRHFDITRWLDYLRGFVPSSEEVAMEEHLGSGCGHCGRTVDLLRELEEVTGRDREYRVPPESVHVAKAAFALAGSHETSGTVSRMIGRLVFDSFARPVPVGVRALRGAERQQRRALYEARDYYIDLSLQQVTGSPEVSLVGQVTSRKTPGQPLAGLKVELVSAEGLVESTVSNSQGEFVLEYQPCTGLQLGVGVNQQSCMMIDLSGIEPASSQAPPPGANQSPV